MKKIYIFVYLFLFSFSSFGSYLIFTTVAQSSHKKYIKNDFDFGKYFTDDSFSDWNVRVSGNVIFVDNKSIILSSTSDNKYNLKINHDVNSNIFSQDPTDADTKTQIIFLMLKPGDKVNGIVNVSRGNNEWKYYASYFMKNI